MTRICQPAPSAQEKCTSRSLQCRKVWWKIACPERGELMSQRAGFPTACRLQILQGKIGRHRGLGVRGRAGSWLVGGEMRIINHACRSRGQFRGLLRRPSVWSHGKVARGSFHLRARELKHNLSQDVIFRSRPRDHQSGPGDCPLGPPGVAEAGPLRGREREREIRFLELWFKAKLNQSHKDPQFQNNRLG